MTTNTVSQSENEWCPDRGRCRFGGAAEHVGCHGHNARTGKPCRRGFGCHMHGQPLWRDALEPFGQLWWKFDTAVAKRVRRLDLDELLVLAAAVDEPGQSNCWYAVYEVAPIVKKAVAREMAGRGFKFSRLLGGLAVGAYS